MSPKIKLSLATAAALAFAGALVWMTRPQKPVTVAPVVLPPSTAVASTPKPPPPEPVAAPPQPAATTTAPSATEPAKGPLLVGTPPPPPTVSVNVIPNRTEPDVPSSAPAPDTPRNEVDATRAMYMAHVSLRAPEEADPDSETNRRILQTMVEKALSLQSPPPHSSTTRN